MKDIQVGQITVSRDGFQHMADVLNLNKKIFGEDRLINRLDHEPMIFLTAHCAGRLAGFKIGYALNRLVFYSAKGAIDPDFRRRGAATLLLQTMMKDAALLGFRELQYDTFPAIYPGMLVLGLRHKFKIINVKWNGEYHDFQIRLGRKM